MKLALCTIQRNRAPWLEEWFAFHALFGVEQFYFFAHRCTDNTAETIASLQKRYDIKAFQIGDDVSRPQLAAYQWAYEQFNHAFDWVAFIDGDEFLFTPGLGDLREVLAIFDYEKLSALGVYWRCFGSSGHLEEPQGRIIENFRWRADDRFEANRHVKSLVRGRQGPHFGVLENAHLFRTIDGTVDEALRPVTTGLTSYEPSYRHLVLHHYVCQSRAYFDQFKKTSGSADAGPLAIRSEEWWTRHDRNEVFDRSLEPIFSRLG